MFKVLYHIRRGTSRTLIIILVTGWMLAGREICANSSVQDEDAGKSSPSQQAPRVRNVKLPSELQIDIPTIPKSSLPVRQVGNIEEVSHKKKRLGAGNGRRSGSHVTNAGDSSWAVAPLVLPPPQPQQRASKPKPASADEDLDEDEDEGDDDEDEHEDDGDEYDKEESKEADNDATADDILTDGNYDEMEPVKQDSRPNIILILTDDQDIELGSMEYMPETLKAFREQGVEFRHGYVTTPMCCPSRSSILTGLYVHNHQVYTNNDNCSSIQWRENFERRTFASYLWDSGYYTSYIGKYLNKYDGSHIPYGWDEWNALLMNSRFYNYTVNRNGVKIRYGSNYKQDYYPNSIANDTVNFLRRMIAVSSQNIKSSSESRDNDKGQANTRRIQQPFLLVASFPSPHGPEDSAPEYKDMFLNTTAHHTPSYNHAPNLDKQWILRVTSKMNPTLKNFTNMLMTKRLQTLQSVDLAVSRIMNLLQESGLSENTYVFYTSDHGYHVGQFGLVKGKSMPYEFDIRVPFFLSPPKGRAESAPPGGTMIHEPVLNIDLAPTFLELGNLPVPDDMDGRSMVQLLRKYSGQAPTDSSSREDDYIDDEGDLEWIHSFLIESSGRRDPIDRNSEYRDSSPATTMRSNSNHVDIFDAGQETRRKQPKTPDPSLIENETTATELALCQLHPYPCHLGQKKYCRREKNRLRFRKCRYDEDFIRDTALYAYGLNITGTNEEFGRDRNGRKCACPRTKRSVNNSTGETEWERERQMIDDEIESLKLRIEELRERRRGMRRKFSGPGQFYNSSTDIRASSSSGNHDMFRSPSHSSLPAASFLPISVGHSKRPKKVKNNNVPVPTLIPLPTPTGASGSANNVTFLSAFNLYPKIDFTTILNLDEVTSAAGTGADTPKNANFGRKKENRKQSQSTRTFHDHSEEVLEDYEDHDGLFEDEDDIWEIDPTDYSITLPDTRGAKKATTTTKPLRKNNNGRNNEEVARSQSRENRPKASQTNEGRERVREDDGENGRNHRNGRKRVKGQRKGSSDAQLNSGGSSDDDCDCTGIRDSPRWLRQQEREERKRKKLLSKLRKKQRFLHRINDSAERHEAETCGSEDKMNCFWHDRSHWRTEPKWTLESFCFCMNANNNTYSCIRTINSTHNYLYCHFITGFKMYFDLNQDSYQLRNTIETLPAHEEDWMLAALLKLKKCQGLQDCFVGKESINREDAYTGASDSDGIHGVDYGGSRTSRVLEPSIWERIFGSRKKKHKKNRTRDENGRPSRKLKQ